VGQKVRAPPPKKREKVQKKTIFFRAMPKVGEKANLCSGKTGGRTRRKPPGTEQKEKETLGLKKPNGKDLEGDGKTNVPQKSQNRAMKRFRKSQKKGGSRKKKKKTKTF